MRGGFDMDVLCMGYVCEVGVICVWCGYDLCVVCCNMVKCVGCVRGAWYRCGVRGCSV